MFKSNRLLYTALAAGFVMPPAQAAVEEITVSAQRRDANLQEVPIAVTALNAEDMERLQINFVADIAKNVPNLQTYTVTAGAAAMQVFMRGAGVQNPGFNASEAPVGIYIDDVYRGRVGTANLDLADVERIEVLRGPQGTLYGRNSIAGAIKVITRTPTDEFYANGSVGFGNYETSKITGSVGGEVADGLGMSIAGLYNRRGEGWINRGPAGASNIGRKLGEYENYAVRSKLNWFGGDVFSGTLTLEYVDAENDGYNAIPYGPGVFPVPSVPGTPTGGGFYKTLVPNSNVGLGRTKQGNAAVDLSWALGGVTLRSLTSFSDIRDRFRFDLNGGRSPVPPAVGGTLIGSTADNSTVTQEFTLAGGSDSFDWIAGVFYMKEQGKQDYRATDPLLFVNLRELSKTDTQSYAIFGEGTWAITEKFSLTVGGRWTLDEKEYSDSCQTATCNSGGVPATWVNDLSRNFNEFTPRLLAQYQLNDNVMIFGGVSRGFQAGGFQTLCFGNRECNQIIYDPQTVVSWEGGIKTDLADDTLRLNVTTFLAQYSGLQQTSIGPPGPFGPSFPVQNVGSADVTGLEVEVIWVPVDGLNIWSVIGLADDEISEASKDRLAPTTERLPGLPRRTVRLGADYRMAAPGLDKWELVLGADLNYASEYFATINNVLPIPSYTRFNGRVGVEQEDGPWSVIFSGTNLTDEDDLFSGIAGSGTNIRTPQPPRMYMLNVNYRL